MGAITLVYVLLIVGGVVWVVYTVTAYARAERERESRWALMASDQLMTRYLDTKRKEETSAGPAELDHPGGSRPLRLGVREGSSGEGRPMVVTAGAHGPKRAR